MAGFCVSELSIEYRYLWLFLVVLSKIIIIVFKSNVRFL